MDFFSHCELFFGGLLLEYVSLTCFSEACTQSSQLGQSTLSFVLLGHCLTSGPNELPGGAAPWS